MTKCHCNGLTHTYLYIMDFVLVDSSFVGLMHCVFSYSASIAIKIDIDDIIEAYQTI